MTTYVNIYTRYSSIVMINYKHQENLNKALEMNKKYFSNQVLDTNMDYRGGNQLYPEINYGSTNATSQQPRSYYQPSPPQQSNLPNQPIVQQPQMQNNPLMVTDFEGHREWTTDLFDCCAEPNTCMFLIFMTENSNNTISYLRLSII